MSTLLEKIFMDMDKIATPTARSIFLSNDVDLREKEPVFFSSLRLKNGVTKTTSRDRMTDVDTWLIDLLPKGGFQKVLDVGISSGVTTVELCELLESNGVAYQMTGMDSDLTSYLVIFANDRSILLDKSGNPIHFEMAGKGFGYVRGTNLKHILDRVLLSIQAWLFIKLRLKRTLDSIESTAVIKGVEIHKIDLVCREIKENPAIRLIEDSIFSEASDERYSLIRAANILNKIYFSDEQLSAAIQKLSERLEPGGLFLVCRTNMEGENNATLFRLAGPGRFEITARFGIGSEIEYLVLGIDGLSTKRLDALEFDPAAS
ncbi:MAG: hypothetical protein ACKVQJ_01420 [Pyrinomonadaceae bacterium]